MSKSLVIYTRFSGQNQREESNEGQERKIRQCLDRLGIDHAAAVVLKVSCERGDVESVAAFERLKAMIRGGEIGILIVDEQSRFSRGLNVLSLIQDLVYRGGRFLTVSEGIDTDRPGWQDLVGLKEMGSRMEIRHTAHRVRRQQELRVEKPNGSAGDYPYGYTSEYEDPAAAVRYRGSGPKPTKRVVIDEAAATVVREVFERFTTGGESISHIVRWWEANKHRFPQITKTVIHHQHVRRILINEKYVGRWSFGKTTTLRDSGGRKKQVPRLPHQQVIVVDRPSLAIVSRERFAAAQARLAQLKDIYGMRADGKKRGPAQYYRLLYEKSFLGGLICCGECGSRLVTMATPGQKRIGCPKHRAGRCTMSHRVPYATTEAAVLALLCEALASYPGWMQRVTSQVRQEVQNLSEAVPRELTETGSRLREITTEIDNLVLALAKGLSSEAVTRRLKELETEQCQLSTKAEQLERARSVPAKLPDEAWMGQQLKDLAGLLKIGEPGLAPMVRAMIGKVIAEPVVAPGKRRGYMRLQFSVDGWPPIRELLSRELGPAITQTCEPQSNGTLDRARQQFSILVGQPTRRDELAPRIAEMRQRGVKWKAIAEQTGLNAGNAYTTWRRWMDAKRRDADDPPRANPTEPASPPQAA